MAVVWALEQLHYYLYGSTYELVTDYQAVKQFLGAEATKQTHVQVTTIHMGVQRKYENIPQSKSTADECTPTVTPPTPKQF